jgi:hypothetical protein
VGLRLAWRRAPLPSGLPLLAVAAAALALDTLLAARPRCPGRRRAHPGRLRRLLDACPVTQPAVALLATSASSSRTRARLLDVRRRRAELGGVRRPRGQSRGRARARLAPRRARRPRGAAPSTTPSRPISCRSISTTRLAILKTGEVAAVTCALLPRRQKAAGLPPGAPPRPSASASPSTSSRKRPCRTSCPS